MELKFKHEGPKYIVGGALEDQKITISLFTGVRKLMKTLTYDEFSEEVKKAFDSIEEIF